MCFFAKKINCMAQNRKDKENLGYTYYVHLNLNIKETALKVGVSTKTVGRWIEAGDWRSIRDANESSPKILLKNYYSLLNHLVEKKLEVVKNKETKELKGISDEISKINKAIETLKKDGTPSLRIHLYCIERYMDHLMPLFDKHSLRSEVSQRTKEYTEIIAKEQTI